MKCEDLLHCFAVSSFKEKKTKIIDKNCFGRFSSNSWILAKSTLQGFFLPDYWESHF